MAAKQKILIVDDDNNIAELISLYLTKECYECKIVNDGEDAIKENDSFHPNLILLDLMLPGMDGYQVCRRSFVWCWSFAIFMNTATARLQRFWISAKRTWRFACIVPKRK